MSETMIENTLDMARFIAFQRALESDHPQSLVQDPLARLLAGTRGEELVHAYMHDAREVRAIGLRTHLYDELIMRLLAEEQLDTIINLAAGLDTRPYRLSLPPSLRWVEVDLPEVLSYKTEKLQDAQANCQLERFPLDILDAEARRSFLSEICTQTQKALVITEGLLIYLSEEQVESLAADLHALDNIGWWLAELVTPLSLQSQGGKWNQAVPEFAHLRFAPPNGCAFFSEHGWEVAEFYPIMAEALRQNLPLRHKWLLRLLVRINGRNTTHTDGFVLFKHA
ncbi:MAG: class I SAM-dependent methyltransferase [Ktedonobacteraceae bacterium]|nr:class I SAM-dependent methyltransferase [Ktedonobacteraceae bacterium]MBO0795356.1 class I SAM-dependent methyltransferase [Ktedonobacteraceae bacterium]